MQRVYPGNCLSLVVLCSNFFIFWISSCEEVSFSSCSFLFPPLTRFVLPGRSADVAVTGGAQAQQGLHLLGHSSGALHPCTAPPSLPRRASRYSRGSQSDNTRSMVMQLQTLEPDTRIKQKPAVLYSFRLRALLELVSSFHLLD